MHAFPKLVKSLPRLYCPQRAYRYRVATCPRTRCLTARCGQECDRLRGDRSLEGFAGRYKGKLFAYENTCRHLPISLDYGDNRFFNTEGEALICQTHGAVYEPDTGLCTRGPCAGASLFPLEIVEGEGTVWLKACEE